MASGPTTRISDVIVPSIFSAYVQNYTTEKSNLIRSGLLMPSPLLNSFLAGGGLTINVPHWKDLDNDAERTSTDTSVPFADADASLPAGVARPPNPNKIGTFQEIAVRMNRNNSWSTSDLAAALAGSDPMAAIASRVGDYWVRRLQAAFISVWKGVLADNTANDSGDLTFDASGASFVDGVTNFNASAFLDATLTMGDSMDDLRAVFVHSVVYNRMQKNNLIDFVADAVNPNAAAVPTFLGRRVVVDDGMPNSGGVYQTWIFGEGATQFGSTPPAMPTEVERKAGGGNGGGQDVLYNRVQWCIHPTGFAWVGSATPDGGPANTGTSNSDLDEATSWDRRVPQRKQIRMARLLTREV